MWFYLYPKDIDRIRAIAWAHGWDMTRAEAQDIWCAHSAKCALSWQSLPEEDHDLWAVLERFIV